MEDETITEQPAWSGASRSRAQSYGLQRSSGTAPIAIRTDFSLFAEANAPRGARYIHRSEWYEHFASAPERPVIPGNAPQGSVTRMGVGCNTHTAGRTGVPFGLVPVASPAIERFCLVPGLPAEAGNVNGILAVVPGATLSAEVEEVLVLPPKLPPGMTRFPIMTPDEILLATMSPLLVTAMVTT